VEIRVAVGAGVPLGTALLNQGGSAFDGSLKDALSVLRS